MAKPPDGHGGPAIETRPPGYVTDRRVIRYIGPARSSHTRVTVRVTVDDLELTNENDHSDLLNSRICQDSDPSQDAFRT